VTLKDRKDRMFGRPIIWRFLTWSQKYVYPYFTQRVGADDVSFINYGYEQDPPMNLPLADLDESNRFSIQLYHRTATQADLHGKRVLEVGCGHGGGAVYIMRAMRPASYTGLDLNAQGIAYCQQRHNIADLEFLQGDAENLPFDNASFDAVINIESSHNYPRFSRFVDEVTRVLRPKGHFLYADLRPRLSVPDWEAAITGAQMRVISARVINEEVVRGMEGDTQRWLDVIDRHVPILQRGLVRSFAGGQRSIAYRNLRSGEFSYRMYCLIKD
jgi:ubiquinone/menaquinone biosynthesis C-methylase UbiE